MIKNVKNQLNQLFQRVNITNRHPQGAVFAKTLLHRMPPVEGL